MVAFVRPCDICIVMNDDETAIRPATVDGCMNAEGRDAFGHSWALMCDAHFKRFGVGLGIGKGKRLHTEEQ